ncbi:MAG: ABC transporter substrate-binding protein [Chloroflexota bacterium]
MYRYIRRRWGHVSIQPILSRVILLFCPLLLLLLAACDSPPTPTVPQRTATPPPPTPTVPDRPRSGTITIRLTADAQLNPWFGGFDANTQHVGGVIFSGLTRLDNHFQPQPDLAESWDVSPDGTALTFHLRRDVLWHDGKPFTSDDVVWSYRMLKRISAQNTSMLHIQDHIKSVDATDPLSSTVRFTLDQRYSPILADLSFPILPSHILSGTAPEQLEGSTFNASPIGTGPFVYSSREPGQSITLKANEHYYGGGPLVDRLIFLVAADNGVAEEAVRNTTLSLSQLSPPSAERLVTEKKGVRGGAYNELGYDYISFNLRSTRPFSDTRVRQAFAYALDKQGLSFTATGGGGDPVWSDVNKASWAYNPDMPQLNGNPDEARRLLAEAGWTDTNGDGIVDKNGKPLEVSLYVRTDNDTRRKAADAMVDPLARVGIRLKVQPADFDTSIRARISPNANPPFDFDAVILGWTRTTPDPDSFALFHSSQIPTQAAPNLLNIAGFQAPEYDTLSIEGRSTYDPDKRREIYYRMQTIIADQLPYYFLWAEKFGLAAASNLKGDIDFSSPNYLWNVTKWWIE